MDLANWSSGLQRNSPQGLNINSIRVSDLIRDPEITIILRAENLEAIYEGFDYDLTQGS